jgi:hypothetical protein
MAVDVFLLKKYARAGTAGPLQPDMTPSEAR